MEFVTDAKKALELMAKVRVTSDIGLRTSDLGLRTSDLGPRTSDLGPRTSDFGPRTSDFGHRTIKTGIARIFNIYGENEPLGERAHVIADLCRVLGT
jgi:hypothetical protein